MSQELEARLESLQNEIAGAEGTGRDALIEQLEQVVMGLESTGVNVPAWAHELLESVHEDEVEEGFDNMPV